MNRVEIPKDIIRLSLYYSLIQIVHFSLLIRAGLILVTSGRIPFPALPPQVGWSGQTLPFLLGMGFLDGLAAGLAIGLGIIYWRQKRYLYLYWILSLTAGLTSAVVFTIGTVPSGAWSDYPIAYGLLVVFFTPLLFLYIRLIGHWRYN